MAQGAVDSLLGRLTALLVSEAQLLGGVRGDVRFIKDEMESMNSVLMHLTDAQHRAHHVRTWMKQVVCLARDCEGYVDLYVRRVGAPAGEPSADNCLLRYLRRLLRLLRTVPARHQVATRIRELKVRARDVGDRRLRYDITVPPAPPPDQAARAIVDKPAPQPGGPEDKEDLWRREQLFSGDPPPDTVVEGTHQILLWLEGWEEWWKELMNYDKCYGSHGPPVPRIIFIVGRGRVGKTSIASNVYQHPSLVSLFPYRAWVNYGGMDEDEDFRGDFSEVRSEIITQLSRQFPITPQVVSSAKRDFMTFRKELERLPRYPLIVLDGVSPEDIGYLFGHEALSTQLWVPKCYVIVTTEHVDRKRGFKILDFEYRKFDVSESKSETETETHLVFLRRRVLALAKSGFKSTMDILHECYTDAFALQMFLHLLYVNPSRPQSELTSLCKTLQENKNNIVYSMLMFCYNELPTFYKTCLLYLSIFPHDRRIRRTTLVRRWVAEGLITQKSIARGFDKGRHGINTALEDQAERIFDVLVDRGFVHPGETSTAGKIKSCTVHHIVHEFIATYVSYEDTCLPPDLAHHLPINSGIASSFDRPFDGIQTLLESMPESSQWQLLKVLDLEGCRGLKKKHLKNICKILLLRYLSLRNTDVARLPKQLEKLQCLETLDIRQTEIRAFSTKSVMLPMLKHLLSGHTNSPSDNSDGFALSFEAVRLPSGIRRMKQLEILSHVEVSDNVNDLTDISQLLELKKLGVILHGKKGGLKLLFQQIEKLYGCLCSLSIRINQPIRSESAPDAEVVPALVNPPKLLESLNISGIAGGLPSWTADLDQLSKITLRETSLGPDDIDILGKLRMLRCLRLLHKSYTEATLNFKAEEFQHLRSVVVEGSDITNISFDTGAAPKLEIIIWSFATMEALSGVDHLLRLKKLELNGDYCNLEPVRAAIEKLPNNPVLKHNPHNQRQEVGTAVAASSSSA